MPPPPRVVAWLQENFPKPSIDPEWLDGCCGWVSETQQLNPEDTFPEYIESVKSQLLQSDLRDSMQHGTGLDMRIGGFTGSLPRPPILVQIIAITEIGSSAFQLEQVRVAREERMLSGVGNEEGEEDGDVEVEGEGPMPKYPRGTLRFQLSDGVTLLEAMEYRSLPQLSLGNTPLGYKMQLKGTRIQNGMAFLEPATAVLLGGKQAELEDQQLYDFMGGLRTRLGLPPAPAAAAVRSPLRDISPPPQVDISHHDNDVDMERSRRVPANTSNNAAAGPSSAPGEPRPIIPLRKSLGGSKPKPQGEVNLMSPSAAQRATLVFAGSQPATTSSYFTNGNSTGVSTRSRNKDSSVDPEKLDFNLSPTTRQVTRTFPSQPSQTNIDPSFDFDFLDEIGQDENNPPPPPGRGSANKGKGRAGTGNALLAPSPNMNDADSDYGMDDDFIDPEFLDHLDKAEKEALGGNVPAIPPATASWGNSSVAPGSSAAASSSLGSSFVFVQPKKETVAPSLLSSVAPPGEVIEIDDSEDEEKENQPVPTRHVRRRTEDMNLDDENAGLGRGPTQSRIQDSQSQRGRTFGRPVIMAADPGDVIDLSDSD